MTIEEAFGIVIRKLRKERFLSQDELSIKSSLDRGFISQLERGKQQPTLVTMFGLAAALNFSVSRMLAAAELLLDLNKSNCIRSNMNFNTNEKLIALWKGASMGGVPLETCDKTILLVEDEVHLRRFLADYLNSQGFYVIVAEDGQEGVNKYKENIDGIDLVLMDIMMPNKDGITAKNEIIKIDPQAIILLMSGYSETSLGGLSDLNFIQKPMLPAKLLVNIRELLDLKEEHRYSGEESNHQSAHD